MERLNILYLVRTWAIGGAHTIVFLLLKHLPRDRFNIICVPYATRSKSDEVFVTALERRGFAPPADRIPWMSRTDWWKARDTLSELIRKYDAALVHTHDPQSNVLVGVGRRRWPCACVASAYGWWTRVFPLRSHVYQYVESRYALPAVDRVITVSQHMRGKVLRGGTPDARLRVIPTGLEPRPAAAVSREQARAALGIPADAWVVGTVSRLYVEKGHPYLIDAVNRLSGLEPAAHLLIVGDGPMREQLAAQAASLGIADRVHFAGFYDDLQGALAAMDALAQPSILDEGLPTSVLEAQLAGVPVVASDIGGTRESMDLGVTGVLAPPRDAAALAAALEDLIRHPDRRAAMAAAGPPFIAQSFPLDRMIAQVAAVYEEAIEANRARR